MLKYITKNIKKVAKYKRIFTASRNALLKVVKPEWLIMNLFMGKVIDKESEWKTFLGKMSLDTVTSHARIIFYQYQKLMFSSLLLTGI